MGRAPCCDKDGLKKGPWLPEEDQMLVDYIEKHGPGNWRILPKKAGLQRCGKSCRLRWTNYLRPDIKRGRFSFEEEETIIQLHSILGNKWSAIAAKLPGRTDNEIKNYWNTHIRKRLLRMGIDPVTHTRRLDLMDLTSLLNSQQQNNSQLNLLKLLSLQTLVNPELLRLATLLSTNQNNGNLNFLLQNLQENQLADPMQNPNPLQTTNPHIQNSLNLPSCSTMTATNAPCASVIGDAQVMQPNLVQYQADISGFDAQSFGAHTGSMLSDQWPNNVLLGSEAPAPAQGFGKVEPDQSQFLSSDDPAIMGAWFDNSAFQPDNSNNQSLSSSQQTPLSSNSMYPNSSSEDEIDSYCRSLLNLDLPLDLFDV